MDADGQPLQEGRAAAAQRAILETIADVAYFQPERALELAAQAFTIQAWTRTGRARVGSRSHRLIPSLVPILRHVAYTYQYVGPAVDLLWTLAKRYRPA